MVPIDLLDAVLPQSFNLFKNKTKPKNTTISVKCSKAKCNTTNYACITRNNDCNCSGESLRFLFKEIVTVGEIGKA